MFSMMLLQSVYVYNIALGKAGMFEKKLIGNMVLWLAASGSKVKSKLWGAYFLAVLVDVCYFMLCNIFFINTVFLSRRAAGGRAAGGERVEARRTGRKPGGRRHPAGPSPADN